MVHICTTLSLLVANKLSLGEHYPKSDIRHLKCLVKHNLLEEYCEMMPSLSVIQHLNPSCCIYEWISFTTPWYFLASLEFKCMQWSKLCFRKQRWCNKKKPPDCSHTEDPLLLSHSVPCTVRGGTANCHQGAGVLRSVYFSISPSLMTFFLTVCLLRASLDMHVHADA